MIPNFSFVSEKSSSLPVRSRSLKKIYRAEHFAQLIEDFFYLLLFELQFFSTEWGFIERWKAIIVSNEMTRFWNDGCDLQKSLIPGKRSEIWLRFILHPDPIKWYERVVLSNGPSQIMRKRFLNREIRFRIIKYPRKLLKLKERSGR